MKNQEVQTTLGTAISLLKTTAGNDPVRVDFLISLLNMFKLYSASGNDIPGIQGPALTNAINLAKTITKNHGKITKFRLDTEFNFNLEQGSNSKK